MTVELNDIKVSIVIVCMNNVDKLCVCLDSIHATTRCRYELLLVAYLFSPENLRIIREQYPWVTIIESNEIRGFSENNNLALRQARGKYCFVVNDDTEMPYAVIDRLIESMEKQPDAAIMSPVLYFPTGAVQYCGRPYKGAWQYMRELIGAYNETRAASPYVNQRGVFQSYNIVGAAFLIKTDVFRRLGWFDERYFFCPEDIALSTKANKEGYKAFVDADVKLIHYHCGTSSKVKSATFPAEIRGELMFMSGGNPLRYAMLGIYAFGVMTLKLGGLLALYLLRPQNRQEYRINILSKYNTLKSIFTTKTPKEIFTRYYSNIKR